MFIGELIQTARFRQYVSSRLSLMLLGLALSFGCRTEFGMAQWWTIVGDAIYNTNAGNVGIGTTAPDTKLHIAHDAASTNTVLNLIHLYRSTSGTAAAGIGAGITFGAERNADIEGIIGSIQGILTTLTVGAESGALAFVTRNSGTDLEKVRITSTGNVGIGTTTPTTRLFVVGPAGGTSANFTDSINSTLVIRHPSGVLDLFSSGSAPITFSDDGGEQVRITSAGNVGIGTTAPGEMLHVAGNLKVDGNIAAKYQDVAEWVGGRGELAAGTVVVLDKDHANQVTASSKPYDTCVAGVVSANPGVILGESGPGKVKVTTTGRVKVRVDATRSPIRIGDLLVTSSLSGVAMRSIPLQVAGARIHRPGTLIGKALEPLGAGRGEILVLLSLQ